jgi:hypothetical protein
MGQGSIEDLAALRDRVIAALADKVAARQKELLAESERGRGARHIKTLHSASQAAGEVPRWPERMDGVGTMPAWAKAKGDTLERFRVLWLGWWS